MADIETLQHQLYIEDLAKMDNPYGNDDESVVALEESLALAEPLQREADWERLEQEFLHRFSSGSGTSAHDARSRRPDRGNGSPRRGQDGRSRSPCR